MTTQALSSRFTFFYKYIFIFVWIFGFGAGARQVLFSSQYDLRWVQYGATWGAIALCIFFATGYIKEVTINRKDKKLEVSNFLRTISVDFSDIEDIDGSSLLSPKLVWFSLKSPSAFGRKISFMPATRATRGIGKHPMVIELRQEFGMDR